MIFFKEIWHAGSLCIPFEDIYTFIIFVRRGRISSQHSFKSHNIVSRSNSQLLEAWFSPHWGLTLYIHDSPLTVDPHYICMILPWLWTHIIHAWFSFTGTHIIYAWFSTDWGPTLYMHDSPSLGLTLYIHDSPLTGDPHYICMILRWLGTHMICAWFFPSLGVTLYMHDSPLTGNSHYICMILPSLGLTLYMHDSPLTGDPHYTCMILRWLGTHIIHAWFFPSLGVTLYMHDSPLTGNSHYICMILPWLGLTLYMHDSPLTGDPHYTCMILRWLGTHIIYAWFFPSLGLTLICNTTFSKRWRLALNQWFKQPGSTF